ncbi:MAG TPA: hypothetical protein VIC28_01345, partial [Thermoanaerobaculia bacterium]
MRGKGFRPSLLLLVLLIPAAAVQAQPPDCGVPPNGQPWGCELKPDAIPSITPNNGVLDTSFVMRERDLYVPVWTPNLCKSSYKVCSTDADCGGATGSCANAKTCSDSGKSCTQASDCSADAECVQTWGWQMQRLRPYGSPKNPSQPIKPSDPNDPNIRWGYPGPVLRARATTLKDPTQPPGPSNPVVTSGTRIKVKLYNYLPKQSYTEAMDCNPATYRACTGPLYCSNFLTGPSSTTCTQQSDCPAGYACLPFACGEDSDCKAAGSKCVTQPVPQHHPNCFHGDSVTNLHLHGTHVSPQAPQDFVLLNLFPFGSTGVPTNDPFYAVGFYQVDANPLPWNQAP